MTKHSIADAKNNLPELIKRVQKGEAVIITRHGNPVAELKPVSALKRRLTEADIDWLVEHRVGSAVPKAAAKSLVSRLRDEDWNR